MIKIPPFHYIHVNDTSTNLTSVEVGPSTFIKKDHLQIVKGPLQMVQIPSMHFCEVTNPAVRSDAGEIVLNEHGEVKVRFGQTEIRSSADFPDPFPLYPYESLSKDITPY